MDEIQCSPLEFPEYVYTSETPLVLRGLVSYWPVVQASIQSNQAAVNYLKSLYNGQPVNAFMAKPEAQGRLFYNGTVDGFNFVQSQVYLDDALNKVIEVDGQPESPTYYVGSLEIGEHLPGFSDENHLPLKQVNARKGIWLGNQSVVAPHYDFPDNIACCVIGQRQFTLFPPEQQPNLYIGPLDLTPAGQAISMVDMNNPDLNKYPRFKRAMQAAVSATLAPGDAIFIPSMWWHSVQSLSGLNGLVNYWWRDTPAYLGDPNNVLLHALMSLKSLPKRQRDAWKTLLNEYVFEPPEDQYDHLPEPVKQNQVQMTETTARKIRAQLINKLK